MHATYAELEAALDKSDEAFKRDLPEVLAGLEGEAAIATLLIERPEAFERLARRMSTLDGIADYATAETKTLERFLTILWDGQELITRHVPTVGEAVTEAFTVSWECEDSPVAFHMVSDPETGTVSGGPTALPDADLRFRGPTGVLFSMLDDPEFNETLAFVQNRFELVGSIERARTLDAMMDTVNDHMRELDPGATDVDLPGEIDTGPDDDAPDGDAGPDGDT